MWFGVLTPGRHPCRPVATPGVVTLYCWNDIARMRIDGPFEGVSDGLRMLRRTMRDRGQAPHDPRCFVCGCPYLVPDPLTARAAAQDWEPRAPEPDDDPCVLPPDLRDGGAFLAFVHLQDDPGEPGEEEALVVVPGPMLATLVPLDHVDRMLEILSVVLADTEPERCEACGAIAPAHHTTGHGGNRAQRRAARRAGRHRPAA